jgi:hypothetical protein
MEYNCDCDDEWDGYFADCDGCCISNGIYDGYNDFPYDPPYKNFSQIDSYKLGYEEGKTKRENEMQLRR